MIQSSEDVETYLREGQSILGKGWKEVESFEELEDADEYESEDEEVYVVMDLGQAIDNKTLLGENSYQLIGLDTPMPFLKIANQVFQGEVTRMIGDEIILGRIRNEENPHAPSRPPWHSTANRLTFRPVTLRPAGQEVPPSPKKGRKARPVTSDLPSASPAPGPSLHHVSIHGSAHPVSSVAPITDGMSRLSPTGTASAQPTLPATTERETSIAEAGPSRLRDSPAPSSPLVSVSDMAPGMSAEVEAVIGRTGVESAAGDESQSPTRRQRSMSPVGTRQKRPSRKTHIATLTDLIEVNARPTQAYHRFTLDPELERQLAPIAKPEHLADIAERGYTPTELRRLAERQPLRGKVISKMQTEFEREAELNAQLTGKRPALAGDDGDVEMLDAGTPTRKGGRRSTAGAGPSAGAGSTTFPGVSGISCRLVAGTSGHQTVGDGAGSGCGGGTSAAGGVDGAGKVDRGDRCAS